MVVTEFVNTVNTPYRWMDQKVALRAEAAALRGELLESKIFAELETIIAKSESHDLQVFVGRVMSESVEDVKDAKIPINTHSLILESSSGTTAGRRVKLFINDCPDYILFSGQIIGVIGRLMAAGTEMHADRILCGPSVPVVAVTRPASASQIHVTIASGPYSPENMLIFDSIAELEVRVRDKAPDKLILMGPFLDAAHPMIAAGTVMDSFDRPVTYEDVYKEEIIPKLARLARACENARTELIIVPSASEARIDFPLPQPPLSALKPAIWEFLVKELPATVKFVSNPATVRVGDLDMYVTSADALSTLNSNVLFKQAENGIGRVDACMEQFLKSRSMFPVTPSALRIEPSMRSLLDLDDRCVPHIFVSPSLAGKRFFKKVADRIFVNPGFMSDATGASSSVAELVISAPADAQGATDLYSRVSGDAIKL